MAKRISIEKDCLHCGNNFRTPSGNPAAKYCGKECSDLGRRTVTPCAICGTEFSIQKCHLADRNYCSLECRKEQDRVTHKERRSKYFPGTCLICGGGTPRKEYKRCQPCKRSQVDGRPKATKAMPEKSKDRSCSVDSCLRLVDSKGMCGMHYMRSRRAAKLTLTIKEIQ